MSVDPNSISLSSQTKELDYLITNFLLGFLHKNSYKSGQVSLLCPWVKHLVGGFYICAANR